ncbi:hypothetical protein DD549_16685 [Shewanella algae]|uniref:L-dopachrome tautomerase-related protein n=1 Tax=Shewanella algae TaxID=38313 RepID=UPI000D65772F|nr:L-dopachrome tautomerase-related protein [Shewanella algae]PWF90840.1 hypothetical protein DD549_16685 [Shewanella algae]
MKLLTLSTLLAGALASFGISAAAASASQFSDSQVQVYRTTEQAVGGISFTPSGRMLVSFHPFYEPETKVAEILADGSSKPFPNRDWQGCVRADGSQKDPDTCLNWVLGLRTDANGIVWLLDSGQASPRVTPKLVAWNSNTDKLERIIHLPSPVSLPESQHNDLLISPKHQLIVIADEGISTGPVGDKAALVVVDLKTGQSRRVLQGHPSVMPDTKRPIVIDAGTAGQKSIPVYVGVDGIAMDKDEEWLYFAPLNKGELYRIPMLALANPSLPASVLANQVQFWAHKPNNGGLSIDVDGNLYLTEVGERRIGIIPASSREYRPFAADPRMIWPDGVSLGADGFLYSAAAQLPLSAPLNDGKAENQPPYYIFRFKPLSAGVAGN